MGAALQLFALHGYHSTSISAIAREAGVAKGLVYNYFASKEEMLVAVFDEGWKKWEETMAATMQPDISPHEALRGLLTTTTTILQQERQFWQLFMAVFTQMHLAPVIRDRFLVMFREGVQAISSLLAAMGVENAEIEAQKVGALLDGVMLHCLYINENYPVEAVWETVLRHYPSLPQK